jgi:ABC-2 type transport system permease protein
MVLGLLAGGVARGMIVCLGIWTLALFFTPLSIAHPIALLLLMVLIATIFSCAGMMAALWAEDFGMLSMWNIYIIVPMALLGGVFHPMNLLPTSLNLLSHFNPMSYLVNGMRFCITGQSDLPFTICAAVALLMAGIFFIATVYLFKAGYKLRS